MKYKKLKSKFLVAALTFCLGSIAFPVYASNNYENSMYDGNESNTFDSNLNSENNILMFKKNGENFENNSDTISEISNEKEIKNDSDLYTYQELSVLLGDSFEVYSYSNSINENSTIDFEREDGSIVKFNSTKDENNRYFFNIHTDKKGIWRVYAFNNERIINEKLTFPVYENIDEFNSINNPLYLKLKKTEIMSLNNKSSKTIIRYEGKSRIETAIKISKENYSQTNSVIVTNAWKQTDAIAASSLAKNLNAPILYVEQNNIPYETQRELERLNVKNIYVIGGESSVSETVKNNLYSDINSVQKVERISGSNRAGTALEIAKKASNYYKGKRAFIVSGRSESDCLAVSAASAENGCLMFYSENGNLDLNSKNYVRNNFSGVYIMNGEQKTSSSVSSYFQSNGLSVSSINGNDSYDLNMKLAQNNQFYTNFDRIYLTSGRNSADGIPGSPLAAKYGVPLLLVNGDSNKDSIVNYINSKNVNKVYIFGGTSSVSKVIENAINNTNSGNQNLSAKRQKVVDLARTKLGKPYVWAATGPNSFDCSGLTLYVYKNAIGINLPRQAKAQAQSGRLISKNNLKPGDLVFFKTTGTGAVSHVGIYIGNNQFIHAAGTPTKPEHVKIANLSSEYWLKTYHSARNIID